MLYYHDDNISTTTLFFQAEWRTVLYAMAPWTGEKGCFDLPCEVDELIVT